VRFHGLRHPRELGADEIQGFLVHLAMEERLAGSTVAQARAALTFLYRRVLDQPMPELERIPSGRRPHRIPVVLTRAEIAAVLSRLTGVPRLVALLLYGGGLRLLEALTLRVKDVDLERRELRVRRAKGGRDRVTVLPRIALGDLRRHLERVRAQHMLDLAMGRGRVALPGALVRSILTPPPRGRGSGCSRLRATTWTERPERGAGIICIHPWCNGRWHERCGRRGWGNGRGVIHCGTVSRRICWRVGPTFGWCRSFLGTGMFRRR
jgi:integrase